MLLLLLACGRGPVELRANPVMPPDLSEGTGIAEEELASKTATSLSNVIRVWGFLKLHHPDVQSGKVEWDSALLDAIASMRRGEDSFTTVTARWRKQLPVRPCGSYCVEAVPDPLRQLSRRWTTQWPELAPYLEEVYANRPPLEGLRYGWDDGALREEGEATFEERAPWTDAGLRVLAVARYWNAVEYFQATRTTTLKDWPQQLPTFVRWAFEPMTERAEYLQLLAAMGRRVRDGHVGLVGSHLEPQGSCRLPVDVRRVEDQFVVFRSDLSDVRVGDRLVSFEFDTEAALQWAEGYTGATEASRVAQLAERITAGPCGPVTVELERGGDVRSIPAERVEQPDRIDPHALSGDRVQWRGTVAYVDLAKVEVDGVPALVEEIAGATGLVLDSRGDFGSAMSSLPYHLSKQSLLTHRRLLPDYASPGSFHVPPDVVAQPPRMPTYTGPVAVLADESSWGRGQAMVVALSAVPRARVFGTPTSGTDGSRMTVVVPGPFRVGLSVDQVLGPDGDDYNPHGRAPDEPVKWTRQAILQGVDPVVEAAVAWVTLQPVKKGGAP